MIIAALTVTATANTVRLDILDDAGRESHRTMLRSQTVPGRYWQMGGDWDHATETALRQLGILELEHGGPGTYGHVDIVAGPVLTLALRSMGSLPR